MNILIKFPTRSRPEQFLKTLEGYLEKCEASQKLYILVSCDVDDDTMYNEDVLASVSFLAKIHADKIVDMDVLFGYSKNKIEAVNADMDHAEKWPWDICLLVSDDMICRKQGWDERIRELFQLHYPQGDGVIWLNDGKVGRRLNTIVLLDRVYYNRFGYLYNPLYKSFFCDNEFQEISEMLGKSVYIDEVIIEHMHPAWDRTVKTDPLYELNNKYWQADKAYYNARKKVNFQPLKPV